MMLPLLSLILPSCFLSFIILPLLSLILPSRFSPSEGPCCGQDCQRMTSGVCRGNTSCLDAGMCEYPFCNVFKLLDKVRQLLHVNFSEKLRET
jgi:hypothetical protein